MAGTIDPAAHIGGVHLTIADLDRSLNFYESHLGLVVHRRDEHTAALGAGAADLLLLTASPGAPRVRGTTGLYHFAVLVPTRRDLARALRRLMATNTVMQGVADHGVSEALYLADPDGNGIEIYRDRPQAEWPRRDGVLQMVTDPLDVNDLLEEPADANADSRLAVGTTIGHVHLHVAHLADAERFYVGVLGFEMMQRYGPSALFVSAGGYHHHIGLNTWAGVGAPPPPAGAIGLRHFDVVVPTGEALAAVLASIRAANVPVAETDGAVVVQDPSGNRVKVQSAGAESEEDVRSR